MSFEEILGLGVLKPATTHEHTDRHQKARYGVHESLSEVEPLTGGQRMKREKEERLLCGFTMHFLSSRLVQHFLSVPS